MSTSVGADGQVTVFVTVKDLTNTVQEVLFLGNQHLSQQELLDMTRVRRGSPLNPAMNQLDAQTILNKLREDGRYHASVTLIEGGSPGDTRVVFQIVEGPIVRLRGVDFRGNREASSGRLRTVVVSTGPGPSTTWAPPVTGSPVRLPEVSIESTLITVSNVQSLRTHLPFAGVVYACGDVHGA